MSDVENSVRAPRYDQQDKDDAGRQDQFRLGVCMRIRVEKAEAKKDDKGFDQLLLRVNPLNENGEKKAPTGWMRFTMPWKSKSGAKAPGFAYRLVHEFLNAIHPDLVGAEPTKKGSGQNTVYALTDGTPITEAEYKAAIASIKDAVFSLCENYYDNPGTLESATFYAQAVERNGFRNLTKFASVESSDVPTVYDSFVDEG